MNEFIHCEYEAKTIHLVLVDGVPAGFVATNDEAGFTTNLWVHPTYRNQGLASVLAHHVFRDHTERAWKSNSSITSSVALWYVLQGYEVEESNGSQYLPTSSEIAQRDAFGARQFNNILQSLGLA